MMIRRLTLTAAAGLCLAACDADTRSVTLSWEHSAAIRDSVRTMLATFQRLSARRQWDSVAALYVSDSTLRWIENGRVVMRSNGLLRQTLGALPPTTSIQTTYDALEITPIAPGVASVLSYYHTTSSDSTRGNATFGGLLTMTIVHRPVGWQFLNGHTSSPPARPSG